MEKNISYIYKESGGHSSACNAGLGCVKTDWVLFIDPDNFLNSKFFSYIDKALVKSNDLKILVVKDIFYIEEQDITL